MNYDFDIKESVIIYFYLKDSLRNRN